MTTIISNIITPPLTENSSVANIAVGTKVDLSDGGEAVYVQADSEIAQFNAVVFAPDYGVVNATTTTVAAGSGTSKQIGFAQTSIASGNYGWVQTSGRPKVKLASACADRVALFTTGTAGVLDDAVVSVAEVFGAVSKTTISNATAVTVLVGHPAFISNHAVQV